MVSLKWRWRFSSFLSAFLVFIAAFLLSLLVIGGGYLLNRVTSIGISEATWLLGAATIGVGAIKVLLSIEALLEKSLLTENSRRNAKKKIAGMTTMTSIRS